MKTYIGIDLGTSSMKFLLLQADGTILSSHSETYPVSYPRANWSEQDPEEWYSAFLRGIPALLKGQPGEVAGISFGGQMHGLVALDQDDAVIRPCILWNDGRTKKQTEFLNQTIGRSVLSRCTANIAFAGFTAPKLLWMAENEPENFRRIRKIMLPKDYLIYRITGVHSTDPSDASGTLLYDVQNRCWSKRMCDLCGVSERWLPRLHESFESVGTIQKALAEQLHLPKTTVVAAGAGDNAAAAIGTGTVSEGDCNISLGTSGTIFLAQDHFSVDPSNALHSFAHAAGNYHLMGCILSAASCNSWWMQILNSTDYAFEQAQAERYIGKNDVLFLPYLMGERSPHNDTSARGAFVGLSMTTTRPQMTLAVLEGVAFALRDCLEVARADGRIIHSTRICGGGAKSALWKRIIANVCNLKVETLRTDEGPSYGAAILAMVACGEYPTVAEAVTRLIHIREETLPDPPEAAYYNKAYLRYRELYPALKPIVETL